MMTKQEFKERLEEKQFNEETIEQLYKALNKMQEVFAKYISEDEIIKRIKMNLNHNIEFDDNIDDRGRGTVGKYNMKEKKIFISSLIQDEYFDIFFHEFLHCISTSFDMEFSGFSQRFTVEDFEDEEIIQYKFKKNGINEGFTEFLCSIQSGKETKSYETLKKLVEKLCMVVDKECLIQIYFNEPWELEEYLEEKGIDASQVLDAFDVILNIQKKLKEERKIGNGKIKLKDIEVIEQKWTQAKNVLLKNFLQVYREVNTADDLERKIQFMQEMEKNLLEPFERIQDIINLGYMEEIFEDVKKLKNNGVSSEVLQQILQSHNLEKEQELYQNKKQILQKNEEEFEEFIVNPDCLSTISEEMEDISFKEALLKKLFLQNHINPNNDDIIAISECIRRVLQKYPQLDINELEFYIVKSSRKLLLDEKFVVCTVNEEIEKKTSPDIIMAIYTGGFETYEFEVEEKYDNEKKTYCIKSMEELEGEMLIDEDFKYGVLRGEDEEIFYNIEKQPSNISILEEKIQSTQERIDKLINMGAPEFFYAGEKTQKIYYENKLNKIKQKVEDKRKKAQLVSQIIKESEDKVGKFEAVQQIAINMEKRESEQIRETQEQGEIE